jgi:hypothetical protein
VCVATHGLVGPVRSGGIATFSSALALLLARSQVNVTVLYLVAEDAVSEGSGQQWIQAYAERGVRVTFLPDDSAVPLQGSAARRISVNAMEWLRARDGDFDVVVFHDWRGSAFFPMQLRRLGLAFPRTRFVLGLHSPTLWDLWQDS